MRFQDYFETHDRLTSQKQIGLVRSEQMDEFVTALLADGEIESLFKAMVFISLSGGLRITECLSLKRQDFHEEEGILFLRVAVLKKRRRELRWARIHPVAAPFIKEFIKNKIGCVVKMSQPTAYRKMRKYFGVDVCNHSLRHSNISYMLFEENMNHLKLAKLLHINVKTVEHYSHLNEKRTLRDVFVP